jgi:hypothetical protein
MQQQAHHVEHEIEDTKLDKKGLIYNPQRCAGVTQIKTEEKDDPENDPIQIVDIKNLFVLAPIVSFNGHWDGRPHIGIVHD